MLLGGYVGLSEAITILRGQWNVYGFFLGLMMISALADEAGVFEVMTNRIARWSKAEDNAAQRRQRDSTCCSPPPG